MKSWHKEAYTINIEICINLHNKRGNSIQIKEIAKELKERKIHSDKRIYLNKTKYPMGLVYRNKQIIC